MASYNRGGARVYISVTTPDGDEINFHRTFRSDDGLWTGSKQMLRDAIDTLIGPAVIAEASGTRAAGLLSPASSTSGTAMSKATFVKDVSSKFTGEARLYKTDDGHVVASSTSMSFGSAGISEVMVFPSTADGEVTDWGELGVAHPAGEFDAALVDAGFEVS